MQSVSTKGRGTTNGGNGEWGDVTDSGGSFTGIAMSATLGSVTIGADINTGWGRLGWNEASWGTLEQLCQQVYKQQQQ